jgi:spermidine synthase
MMRLISPRKLAKSVTPAATVEVSEQRGVRELHLGTGAIQSAMRVSRPWDLELAYTRAMMAGLLFCPMPQRVLMIGLGGGSLAKFIRHHRPGVDITAVEISREVLAAARTWFALPEEDACLHVEIADGAEYLPAHPACADLLFVDGFDAGNQVPQLATTAFYQACRQALRPAGVLVVNLWGRDPDFAAQFARLVAVFEGQVAWLPVHSRVNVIAFAWLPDDPVCVPESAACKALEKDWGLDFRGFAANLNWPGDLPAGVRAD